MLLQFNSLFNSHFIVNSVFQKKLVFKRTIDLGIPCIARSLVILISPSTNLVLSCPLSSGELLSPGSLDGMDEGAVGEEAGASSSSAGIDSDSLAQPTPIPLVETIDEALAPDIIAGTPGTSSVFQSALVGQSLTTFYTWTPSLYYDECICVKLFFFFPLLASCILFSVFFSVFCMASCSDSFILKESIESFYNQFNSEWTVLICLPFWILSSNSVDLLPVDIKML